MKRFCLRVALFFVCAGLVVSASSRLPNPSLLEQNLLGALPEKMKTIGNLSSPKILLVGGSNVSFGMDTERLSKHFGRPAFNTSMHAGLGLKFMMLSCLPSVGNGDVVVVIPEYSQFQGGYGGAQELVAALCDVYPEGRATLSSRQAIRLLPEFISYSALKLCQRLRLVHKPTTARIYARDSFNQYGDAVAHWELEPTAIAESPPVGPRPQLDAEAIEGLLEFRDEVESRGAQLIMLPPCFMASSYENQRHLVEAVDSALAENGIAFDAPCQRYRFERKYFFNTPYHLNKEGVDLRTELVIENLAMVTERSPKPKVGPTGS
ncbi:MAG: hypothetical protein AAFU85_07715 [Planctomycetota bacterium]